MKRSMMQTVFLLVFLLYPLCAGASVIQEKVYDICKYGAKGDGKTLNTNAINSAIEYCAENGVTNIFHGGYVSRFLPTVEQYPLIYIVIFNVGILYIGDEGIVVSISTKSIEERSKHG